MPQGPSQTGHTAPFITLEGGEGTGKSTQVRMMVRRLAALGLKVLATREPGATALGANIRRLVSQERGSQEPTAQAELLLYLADRAQHVAQVIRPALLEGKMVVSDRFLDSSEVYQGHARGLGAGQVRRLNQWVCGGIWPDLTVVLDLDPSLGLARVKERQGWLGLDRLESQDLAFHEAVRRGFLEQAKAEPERIKVVAADQPPDEVADEVWSLVEPLARGWKDHAA